MMLGFRHIYFAGVITSRAGLWMAWTVQLESGCAMKKRYRLSYGYETHKSSPKDVLYIRYTSRRIAQKP